MAVAVTSRRRAVINALDGSTTTVSHGRGMRFARSPVLSINGVAGTNVGGTWTIDDADNWETTTNGIRHDIGGSSQRSFGAGDFPVGTEALRFVPEVDGVEYEKAGAVIVLERQDNAGDTAQISLGMGLNPGTEARIDVTYDAEARSNPTGTARRIRLTYRDRPLPNTYINCYYVGSGIRGPAGPQGPQGDPGQDGAQGMQGPRGLQGEKGEDGSPGAMGSPGAQGAKGNKGDKGDDGARGERGLQGPQGIQGIQGVAGPKGDDGARGPTGPMGSPGPTGLQGPKGDPGRDGNDGQDGARGPIGPTGPQGPQGMQGIPGQSGDDAAVTSARVLTAIEGFNSTQIDDALEHLDITENDILRAVISMLGRVDGAVRFGSPITTAGSEKMTASLTASDVRAALADKTVVNIATITGGIRISFNDGSTLDFTPDASFDAERVRDTIADTYRDGTGIDIQVSDTDNTTTISLEGVSFTETMRTKLAGIASGATANLGTLTDITAGTGLAKSGSASAPTLSLSLTEALVLAALGISETMFEDLVRNARINQSGDLVLERVASSDIVLPLPGGSGSGLTREQIEDLLAGTEASPGTTGFLRAGTNTSFDYDDSAGTLTINSTGAVTPPPAATATFYAAVKTSRTFTASDFTGSSLPSSTSALPVTIAIPANTFTGSNYFALFVPDSHPITSIMEDGGLNQVGAFSPTALTISSVVGKAYVSNRIFLAEPQITNWRLS